MTHRAVTLLRSPARHLVDELCWIEMHHTRRSIKDQTTSDVCTPSETASREARCEPCLNRDEAVSWLHLLRDNCIAAHDWV